MAPGARWTPRWPKAASVQRIYPWRRRLWKAPSALAELLPVMGVMGDLTIEVLEAENK